MRSMRSAEAGLMPRQDAKLVLYSGNSNPALASEIAVHLGTQVGRSITSSVDDEHFVFPAGFTLNEREECAYLTRRERRTCT